MTSQDAVGFAPAPTGLSLRDLRTRLSEGLELVENGQQLTIDVFVEYLVHEFIETYNVLQPAMGLPQWVCHADTELNLFPELHPEEGPADGLMVRLVRVLNLQPNHEDMSMLAGLAIERLRRIGRYSGNDLSKLAWHFSSSEPTKIAFEVEG